MTTLPKHHSFNAPGSAQEESGTHTISYVEWGESANENVLFCVHGLTRNSRDFDHLARALAPYYRIICPDVAGRGKSEWLKDSSSYNYGTYIADLTALIAHLKVKQLDWVGTSMGGLIGMTIAAFNPKLIRNLVLNDIGPFVAASALQRIGKYVGKSPVFSDMNEVEAHMRTIYSSFGINKDEDWQHLVQHGAEEKEGKWRLSYDPAISQVFAGKDMQDIDLWEMWGKIESRILVLRGALSDILSYETARKMEMKGNEVTLVEFPAVGHAPALMDAEQIEVIKNWLLKGREA